jgi:hypothetical protein
MRHTAGVCKLWTISMSSVAHKTIQETVRSTRIMAQETIRIGLKRDRQVLFPQCRKASGVHHINWQVPCTSHPCIICTGRPENLIPQRYSSRSRCQRYKYASIPQNTPGEPCVYSDPWHTAGCAHDSSEPHGVVTWRWRAAADPHVRVIVTDITGLHVPLAHCVPFWHLRRIDRMLRPSVTGKLQHL